jgi:hypothetical protein
VEEAEPFAPKSTLKWARLQGAVAIYHARLGKLHDALDRLQSAVDLVGSLGNTQEEANLRREQSVILHRLGHVADSREHIRMAMGLAECGTTAASLRQTRHVAKRILSSDDPLFKTLSG